MKQIIKNYTMNVGYQLIVLLVPFISIPYLSRVLGPHNLGVEAYVMSITVIYIAFANAGTSIYAIRQVAFLKNDKIKLTKEVYNILIFRLILAIGSLIFFIIPIQNTEYYHIFLIQSVFLIGSTFFDCTWYFIGKEQFKIIILRNLAIKIIGLVLIVIFVKDTNDLEIYLWINALTVLLPNILLFYLLLKELGKLKLIYISFLSIKGLIANILPFFILGIVTQIYMNIDKIILEKNNLIYELGFYTQFVKSYSVFLAPITAVGTILMPRLSNMNSLKEDNTQIIKLSSNFIFLLCVPIIFGLLVISNEFVVLFFGNDFQEYIRLFQLGLLLIFTGSLSNIVIQQVIFPKKLEKKYNLILALATIIRVAVIFILIKQFGIYAAVLGYIVSELTIMVVCIYISKNIINLLPILISFNNLKIFSSGLLMYLIVENISIENIILKIFAGILIYLILLFLVKEEMSKILYKQVKSLYKKI